MAQLRHLAHAQHLIPVLLHIGQGRIHRAIRRHGDRPAAVFFRLAVPVQGGRQTTAHHPFVGHAVAAPLHRPAHDVAHDGVDERGDGHDAAVLHLRQLLVFLHQLLPRVLLPGSEGTDLAHQTADLAVPVAVRQAHLAEHDRAQVLLPDDDGHRHVHDAAVAEIDEGLVAAHGLQSGQRVAAVAALAGDRVLPDHGAEGGPPAVLGDGNALVVDGDDGRVGQRGQLILHRLPARHVQQCFQIKIRPRHCLSIPSNLFIFCVMFFYPL